jgi:hypothetical protein
MAAYATACHRWLSDRSVSTYTAWCDLTLAQRRELVNVSDVVRDGSVGMLLKRLIYIEKTYGT